jgi:nickel/cobalt transporter (NiCoT) family protein
VISLPLLFAAGMSLIDTADGALMVRAYGWAFSSPVRRIFYNLTVTACRWPSPWRRFDRNG